MSDIVRKLKFRVRDRDPVTGALLPEPDAPAPPEAEETRTIARDQTYTPQTPVLNIPSLQDRPIQKATGVAGEHLDDQNDFYGPEWARREIMANLQKWYDPYYQFVVLVAGFSDRDVDRLTRGATPSLKMGALAASDADAIAQAFRADVIASSSAKAAMRDKLAASADASTASSGSDPEKDALRRYELFGDTRGKTLAQMVQEGHMTPMPVHNRWKAAAWMLQNMEKVSAEQIRLLNEMYAGETPNHADWTMMLSHIGTTFLDPSFVAATEMAYKRVLDVNRARQEDLPFEGLIITSPGTRTLFAQLAARILMHNSALAGKRMMTVDASKQIKLEIRGLVERFRGAVTRRGEDGRAVVELPVPDPRRYAPYPAPCLSQGERMRRHQEDYQARLDREWASL